MARFNFHQNNFTTGKLGKRFQGRTDLQDYYNGLDEMSNMITQRQGGATKRPGTRLLIGSETINSTAQLIPFVFSKTESYVVIIDAEQASINNKIKIYRNEDLTSIEPVLEQNQYLIDGGLSTGLTGLGEYIYAQSGDVLLVTHTSNQQKPIQIARRDSGGNTFVVQYFNEGGNTANDFVLTYPYLDPNITATTMTPSATTGAITITASAAFFETGHVGSPFKITQGTATGVAFITSFVSSTVVNATVQIDFFNTSASDNWQESAWSDVRGYPGTVVLFEQRTMWGGTTFQPDTFYASLTGNFFHMMERRLAQDLGSSTDVSGLNYFGDEANDDPFSRTLASTQVNRITWMASSSVLQIGTFGGEYIVSSEGDQGFGKLTASSRLQTPFGGDTLQPVQINQDTIFVTRDGKKLRNFRFNRDNGSFISVNLNANNEEIINHNFDGTAVTNLKFKQLVYQQSRDCIWAVTDNNELVGLTMDADVGVLAWHGHSLGGVDTKVLSVTSTPNETASFDDVIVLVERTINSSTVRYIEKITQDFDGSSLSLPHDIGVPLANNFDDYPWYVDSAVLRLSDGGGGSLGIAGTTVSQLLHLQGETVRVLGDGVDLGTFVVDGSGEIDVNVELTQAIVGLPYSTEMIPVPIEAGAQLGSAQGLTKKIDRTMIRLYKTRGLEMVNLRNGENQKIAFDALFTGDKFGLTPNNIDDRGQFKIIQDNAYPQTILSLTYRGATYDR